jgi:hypothetical protein
VDVYDGEAGWGEHLWAKIVIDLTKSLARGRMLHLQGRSTWVAFRYEKLPKFCYDCGTIKHAHQGCSKTANRSKPNVEETQPYGPWLRVQFPLQRGMGGEHRNERDQLDGAPNTGQYCRVYGNRPEGSWKPNSMSTDHDSDDGGDTTANPSLLVEAVELANDNYGKAGKAAQKLHGHEEREGGVMEYGKKWKVWVAKEGNLAFSKTPVEKDVNAIMNKEDLPEATEGQRWQALGSQYVNNEADDNSTEGLNTNLVRPSSGPKQKYLGQWDSKLGRMTYEPLDEASSVAFLAKDPNSNTYLPCLELGSNQMKADVSKEKPISLEAHGVSNGTPNPHGDHSPVHTGSVTHRKKRAHRAGTPQDLSGQFGTMEGKRKMEMGNEVEVSSQKKRGKKIGPILSQPQVEPVGVVEQPRLTK